METIKTKRLYLPAEQSDGWRVLVDRLWPRGIAHAMLPYDLWAKQLAPSTPLRQWYHADSVNRWAEFKQRYLDQLQESSFTSQFIDQIRQHDTVTLLYAAHDTEQNHAQVLKEYLQHELLIKG